MVFLKKYDDCFILTKVYYDCEKFNIYTEAKKHRKDGKSSSSEDEKLNNNLIRSRQKIFDYAYCNKFNYFITLTISSKYDRTDYLLYMDRFSQVIRNLRKKYKTDIEYLLIPEFHKDGVNVHFHGLLKSYNISKDFYLNDNGFYSWKSIDFLGFNSISAIKSNFNVSCYITKYITKGHLNVAKKRNHNYFVSNGLSLPDTYEIKEDINFDDWDFQNFYCKKKKLSLDYFDNKNLELIKKN